MKTKTTKVSLLALALLAIGCNEQVAPELKGGNNSDSTNPPVIMPDEFVFRVVNKSPLILNYKLHRTGMGRSNTHCEIKQNFPFTDDLYQSEGYPTALPHDSKVYDITCFFEAEELALYHSGFSFAYEASPNTCEFVSYGPYSYYEYQPGTSSSRITQTKCEGEHTNDSHVIATGASPAYGPGADRAVCGESVDTSIPTTSQRAAFGNFEDPQDYCRFDYSKNDGPNCDEGNITFTTMTFTRSLGDSEAVPPVPPSTNINREVTTHSCGGKAANCIAGAIKHEPVLENMTSGRVITRIEKNESFSRTVDLPGLIEEHRGTNLDYANYRRTLASPHIDFVDPSVGAYRSAFSDMNYWKGFDPALLDKYSNNYSYNTSQILSDADTTAYSRINGYTARPLAAEPSMGLGSSYRTSPFYTFSCLDRAMETKARIRIVVRDWDRLHPGTDEIEILSDIFAGRNARQDIPSEEEIPGDQDPNNRFNDIWDWDDMILMTRTPGSYNAGTRWLPYLGPFLPENFPKQRP